MDEQDQVVPRRRRRGRAEAGQLVAEYEASGLSRAEFCGCRGLSLATLTRYQKWRRADGTETPPGNRWVCVELADAGPGSAIGTGSGLAVTLATGRRIEVGRGFDAQTLAELLGVLDRF